MAAVNLCLTSLVTCLPPDVRSCGGLNCNTAPPLKNVGVLPLPQYLRWEPYLETRLLQIELVRMRSRGSRVSPNSAPNSVTKTGVLCEEVATGRHRHRESTM